MKVSLYALSDSFKTKTISLQGFIKNTTVSILVDTGRSHSFISPELVKNLEFQSKHTGPLVATLADGNSFTSQSICKQVQWLIQ